MQKIKSQPGNQLKEKVSENITPCVGGKSPEPGDPEPMVDNIVLECAINGDLERLSKCFKDPNDIYHAQANDLLNKRSEADTKSPLDWASLLGRPEIISELLSQGADVNSVNASGKHRQQFVISLKQHKQ